MVTWPWTPQVDGGTRGAEIAKARGGSGGARRSPARQAGHSPDEPRRWDPIRWTSTNPTADMSANIVVGPTKTKPSRLSAAAKASDSGDFVGISSGVRGMGVESGRNDQTKAANPPC